MLVTLRNQRVKRQCCIIALVSILEFGSMTVSANQFNSTFQFHTCDKMKNIFLYFFTELQNLLSLLVCLQTQCY